MAHCKCVQAIDNVDHDCSLLLFNGESILPAPKSRSFELPGDRLQYAPDRPADMQHVKLVIALDFDQETVAGTVYTTFSALYEEVRTVSFDAIELQIEKVSLENGPELVYTTTGKKLIVTLDRIYHHGEVFTIAVQYHAKPRIGLHFIKPARKIPHVLSKRGPLGSRAIIATGSPVTMLPMIVPQPRSSPRSHPSF